MVEDLKETTLEQKGPIILSAESQWQNEEGTVPTLKSLVRDLTPPLIWRVARDLFKSDPPKLCGVYKTFTEIPQENQWESDLWFKQQRTALDESTSQTCSYLPNIRHPCDLTALYLNQLSWQKKVTVLDFGGAGGDVYYHMARGGALLYPDNVDWTVVDAQNVLALGEKVKSARDRISFVTEVPAGHRFDVVHISTVLQYIDDINAVIEKLREEINPSHLIFTRLLGGSDNPEYFTKNYAFGRHCPIHVFNIRKLVQVIEERGWHLVLRAGSIEEKLSPNDYCGVPSEWQNYNTSHLIFAR